MATNKRTLSRIGFYCGLALFLIITLFPFFVMLMTSFKGAKEAISLHPTLLPQQWTLEHYVDIFNPMIFPFVDYFRNSLVVSVVSSVVAVFLGILGAYALSRLRFKGRMTINASFYTVYMFSGILLVVPLFKIITALGIYDTEMALIITMVTQTLPTAVFMLKSYFDTIPDEIEEAAMMDGLNRLQIIFRITVPLAMSGLIKGISRDESLRRILQHGGKEGDFNSQERAQLAYRKNLLYVHSLRELTVNAVLPGIRSLLADLRAQQISVGLASVSLNAPTILAALELREFFTFCADASQLKNSKPDSEIFLAACAGLGVPPQACIGIEDAQAGIDAINASGMRSVGIGAGLTGAQLLLPSTESLTWPRLSAFWQNV